MRKNPDEIVLRLTKDVPPEDVRRLYLTAGWITQETSAEYVMQMVRNSFAFYCAFDGARLIGFMRALSDGISDAYLLDLIVDPAYRKEGIGRALTEGLSDYLRSLGIDWIVCIGAPGTESFYKTTNMKKMESCIPYRFPEKG